MEPRKATDILLMIEAGVNQILAEVRSLSLNNKINSNKLSEIIKYLQSDDPNLHFTMKEDVGSKKPHFSIEEAEAPEPDLNIKMEADPLGFRRTSRPETYATPTQMAQVSKPTAPVPPVSVIQTKVPPRAPLQTSNDDWKNISMPNLPKIQAEEATSNINKVSVEQRVVDKGGKAIFLAFVEITNKLTNKIETKTRTTSSGKWQAVLPPGNYDIKIVKSESMSKEKLELNQEIQIDGRNPTQQLPMVIAK